jgi:hypothetical protein
MNMIDVQVTYVAIKQRDLLGILPRPVDHEIEVEPEGEDANEPLQDAYQQVLSERRSTYADLDSEVHRDLESTVVDDVEAVPRLAILLHRRLASVRALRPLNRRPIRTAR